MRDEPVHGLKNEGRNSHVEGRTFIAFKTHDSISQVQCLEALAFLTDENENELPSFCSSLRIIPPHSISQVE